MPRERRRIRRASHPSQVVVRRSDESIREEICQSLTRHPDLDASGLQVQVEGGEVTLSGRVDHRDARWLAEDLIEPVSGVSLVHNQLRVAG